MVSDNEPYYPAIEFRHIMDDMGVYYIISSAHYLQSNGLAVKCFQLV